MIAGAGTVEDVSRVNARRRTGVAAIRAYSRQRIGRGKRMSELLIELDYLTHRGPGLEPIEATIDILKR